MMNRMPCCHAVRLLTLCASLVLTACGGDKVAEIDGEPLTKAEFDAYLKFKRIDGADEGRRKAALDNLVERKALAAAIVDEDKLDHAAIGAELEDFRLQMLLSRYFEVFLNEAVNDAAVENFYRDNAARWSKKKVRVAHILVRTRPDMAETELQAKQTQAREAWSQLNAGKSFEEIAKRFSEDDLTAKLGGELGWIGEGAVDQGFSEKVFAMQQGQVSEPFKTHYGFHIVKIMEGPATVTDSLEAVRGDIRHELRNAAKEAELKRLLAAVDVERVE